MKRARTKELKARATERREKRKKERSKERAMKTSAGSVDDKDAAARMKSE